MRRKSEGLFEGPAPLSYSGNVSIVFNIVLGLFTRITHNHLEGNQRKSFILPHYKHSGGETPEKYKIDCWNSKGDLCLREKYYGENNFYLFYFNFIPVFYIILNNIIGDMIYSWVMKVSHPVEYFTGSIRYFCKELWGHLSL